MGTHLTKVTVPTLCMVYIVMLDILLGVILMFLILIAFCLFT